MISLNGLPMIPVTDDTSTCEHEDCPRVAVMDDYCDAHYEIYFCECGRRLEDSWGSPGDNLCRACD